MNVMDVLSRIQAGRHSTQALRCARALAQLAHGRLPVPGRVPPGSRRPPRGLPGRIKPSQQTVACACALEDGREKESKGEQEDRQT